MGTIELFTPLHPNSGYSQIIFIPTIYRPTGFKNSETCGSDRTNF